MVAGVAEIGVQGDLPAGRPLGPADGQVTAQVDEETAGQAVRESGGGPVGGVGLGTGAEVELDAMRNQDAAPRLVVVDPPVARYGTRRRGVPIGSRSTPDPLEVVVVADRAE